jgi:uncharacterized protein with ParB-like and HNH nuclease domain
MQTTSVTIQSLFGQKVQYRIPLFQRHYVWTMEDQWQPLWEDIEEKSTQHLLQQIKERCHFTGAIVIQQKLTNTDEVRKYEIIDGQQRLTTFQIILCALRDVCVAHELEELANELKSYSLNSGMLSHNYKEDRYKLIPTEFDKLPLLELLEDKKNTDLKGKKGRINEAYDYFFREITDYSGGDKNKLLSILYAVLNDFGLVQILIDSDDEPELIFESLNGRGKALLQFDLLRNNLFLKTRKSDEDRDSLYRDYWQHFESDFWEQEKGIGSKINKWSEWFFQHFLTAKLGSVSVSPLFNTYKRTYRNTLENEGSKYELIELHKYSKVYEDIINGDKNSDIGRPMNFYKIFDISSLYSFVLFLKNEVNPSDSNLEYIFRILESYTLRRMLCTTNNHRQFNKIFADIICKFKKNEFNIKDFITILSNFNAASNKWPSDHEVKLYFNGLWPAIDVSRDVIKYILYRIEYLMRSETRFGESDVIDFKQFSLEHILPDKWKQHWKLPVPAGEIKYENMFSEDYKKSNPSWESHPSKEGLLEDSYLDAYELAWDRDELKQSIGNLTIITGKHNASLSNHPFEKKRQSLFDSSNLMLNKELHKTEIWDVSQIREREDKLYAKFCKLWPDDNWFVENIP